jgi:membrane AbrB-like protein
MLGPLFVSIALTVTETGLSAMPTTLSNIGQLLIGCSLGARFERGFLQGSPRYLFGVIASIGLALVLSALSGVALAYIGGLAVPTMILATAPGGIAEMGITAKVLQLGVPLVTAFHLMRVILIVTTSAPLFNIARQTRTKYRDKGSGKE